MNLITIIYKTIHWPICRTYARHLGDKPASSLFAILCSLYYLRVYRFWPNLRYPQRFTEKLWQRMLYMRDPILTLISDKLLVRDYVTQKDGNVHLIPLLWYGNEPEQTPFDRLPDKFVIKTNHGCGYNILVQDKIKLDIQSTKNKLKKWLGENFCQDKYLGTEWGYKNIKPFIMVEEFLGNQKKAPVDFKFYCFAGHVDIITVHLDRFEEKKFIAYDRLFQRLENKSKFKHYDGPFQLPPNCMEMVQIAENLSEDFDFIRVDLYNLEGVIYFGELTPYPGGVSTLRGFDLKSYDVEMGEKWKIAGR
jgi:hypothetical protein